MYKAKIITIETLDKHPNADRLQLIRYNGLQFVVDLSFKIGDVVILFPTDGQLSHEFCHHNNLYRDGSKNADPLQTGFFEDNRRVRAQPFRKEQSEGFVAKLSSLNYLGKVTGLEPGYEFDMVNGKVVCEKYLTEATRKAALSSVKPQKTDTRVYHMPKHYDTPQLAYEIDKIESPCLIIITEKMHGTSGRTGYVLTEQVFEKPFGWLERILARIFRKNWNGKVEASGYVHVSGTRNTIINERPEITSSLGKEHFRWLVHQMIAPKLYKGETVYYEIVGFDTYGGSIMQPQNTTKMEDKSINKKFGNVIVYSYNCAPKGTVGYEDALEHDVYVYRITQQGHDGRTVELSWFQMINRCKELGLKNVPVLDMGYGSDDGHAEPEAFAKIFIEASRHALLVNGASTVDNGHLMEGICVRIESERGTVVLKEKNYAFKVLEGILKESSSYVDTEEIS